MELRPRVPDPVKDIRSIPITGPMIFKEVICESCGVRAWCGVGLCGYPDQDHRHDVCSECLGILSLGYLAALDDKIRGAWKLRRCPPVVTEAERALRAIREWEHR